MYCKGKKADGSNCSNWAIKGSYYCQRHQGQVTEKDKEQMASTQSMTTVIIIIGLIIAFIISVAGGCEEGFLKWLSR